MNVAACVVDKFMEVLSWEEREQLKLIAIWKAAISFDPKKNIKFTTHLYNCAKWETYDALKEIGVMKKGRRPKIHLGLEECVAGWEGDLIDIDFLPPNLQEIIVYKYIFNMTLQEIGEIYGLSISSVRRRLLEAEDKIKVVYN